NSLVWDRLRPSTNRGMMGRPGEKQPLTRHAPGGHIMKIVHTLVGFALETVVGTSKGTATVGNFLERCFADPSQRLNKALQHASQRTWQTVEVALAGDSLWGRLKRLLTPADETAFRQQIRSLLQIAPLPDHPNREQFCQAALAELQAARKAG